MPRGANNPWIQKLRVFNMNGNVWAIPRAGTAERKLLDEGKNFKEHYTLGLVSTVAGKGMTEEKPEAKLTEEPAEAVKEEVDEMTKFALAFYLQGEKITPENVFYVGNNIWTQIILLDILEKNANMSALVFTFTHGARVYKSFEIDFAGVAKDPTSEISLGEFSDGNRFDCARQIYRAHQQKKIIIFNPIGLVGHANLMIYRPDSNTLEHFEPHGDLYGSPTKDIYISSQIKKVIKDAEKQYKKAKKDIDDYIAKMSGDEKDVDFNLVEKLDEAEENLRKANYAKTTQYREKRKKFDAKLLGNFVKDIWKKGKEDPSPDIKAFFKKTKVPSITSTQVLHELVKGISGFQTLENSQISGYMSLEDYEQKIGGYCVMWSAFAMELIAKNPQRPTKEVIAEATEKINKMGDKAWLKLMIGYVHHYEKIFSDLFEKAGLGKFEMKRYRELERQYNAENKRVEEEKKKKIVDLSKAVADLSKTTPFKNAYWSFQYYVSDEIEKMQKKGRL